MYIFTHIIKHVTYPSDAYLRAPATMLPWNTQASTLMHCPTTVKNTPDGRDTTAFAALCLTADRSAAKSQPADGHNMHHADPATFGGNFGNFDNRVAWHDFFL